MLHTPLRLAIVSLLVNGAEAEFNQLKESTGATAGNLSVQINTLRDAGYIVVEKHLNYSYPRTVCTISPAGNVAFDDYVYSPKSYFRP
jgi:DNA-binding transcriptional ArsR family regulator